MLRLKPGARVEKVGARFWVETDSTGHYADVSSEEESRVLALLQQAPWEEVVAQRFSSNHPWLHSIIVDSGRSLFLDFLPLKRGGKFLDVGAGWGQIAIPLSRIGEVYCLDITLARLRILEEIAKQEGSELRYVCGNYLTFPFGEGQFDLIVFNGSLEWIALGLQQASIQHAQREALLKAHDSLAPGGFLYIGIENSLGLKYLLGAPDDHTCLPFLSFLSEEKAQMLYASTHPGKALPAKTWSLVEYQEMLEAAGLEVVEIFGCFPDYKLIRQMIPLKDVNVQLASHGLPYPEHSGIDGSTLTVNGQLDAVYRLLAKNGIAQYFCPSYGMIARKPE